MKCSNDFEQALIVSVNHGGDSDSTGAVNGGVFEPRGSLCPRE